MNTIIIISQALLYISFAFLMGYFLIQIIPSTYRPEVQIPQKYVFISIVAVPILSLMPVLHVTYILSERFGFISSFATVITSYKIGFSWDIVFLISIELLIFYYLIRHRQSTFLHIVGALQVLLLIAAVAWASHAVTMEPVLGFIANFVHVLAVSVWVGLVLIISWFSTDKNNWDAFLKWFSPTAISAFGLVAISGILLADTLVPDYITGWSTAYGQGLLIKHLFLIPLVFYILVNGLLVKLKLKNSSFDPRPWAKLESIILLAIFVATAIYSQYQPPNPFLTEETVSNLFMFIYDTAVQSGMTAHLQMNWIGLLFIVLGVICIALILVSFFKRAPIWIPLIIGIGVVVCFYFFFMSIVVFSFIDYCL